MHNKITSLITNNRSIIEKNEDIKQELVSFYHNLLTKSTPNRVEAIHLVTEHIPRIITEDQNNTLMRHITLQEVEPVIDEMANGKVPRTSGFIIIFFHHY